MSKTGLQIRQNSNVTYDSTRGHLLVDADKDKGHFKVATINATPLTAPANVIVTDTVMSIPHGLPYAPLVDAYFFPAGAAPNQPDKLYQLTDSYYHYFFSFISLGGPFESTLTIKVDTEAIRVIHTWGGTLWAGGTDAPFPAKMKYTIFSNEGYPQF